MSEILNESEVLVSEVSVGSRKKQKNVSKRDIKKQEKYSTPSGSAVFIPCTHNGKTLQCCKVRPNDAIQFRKILYSKSEKLFQDQMVSRFIATANVNRRRSRQSCLGIGLPQTKAKPKTFSASYKFPLASGKQVTVCKKFFLHLMKFKPERVRTILSKLNNNKGLEETRGGDQVSHKSLAKKQSVRKFIGSLKGTESHYSRSKSKRVYLRSDLSIRKLHTIYNDCQENPLLKVTPSMFRKIFCGEFNLGFKSPATDICGYCAMLDNKLKNASPAEKQILFTEKRIHKKRAKCFYELIRETNEGEKTLCFDMQQVQPLPKTPVQQAFYARQLGLYNVCVMDVQSNKPSFYIWTEEQAGRGSVEVASALLAFLNEQNLCDIVHIRLFCDGCTGQNKNNHVLHALMYYLAKHEGSLNKISINFPVRGHSFLPADRVFGQAEKLLRKKPTMIFKEEYFDEYQKVGEVKKLGSDWLLINVKSLAEKLKSFPKISDMKRIYIQKVVKKVQQGRKINIYVTGNEFYRFEGDLTKHSLLKKNCNWENILTSSLEVIPLVHQISAAKKKDVNELLTILFENQWKEDEKFEWYNNIVNCVEAVEHSDEEEVLCDCLEHDCAIHI